MKFSAREDIEAPVDQVFAELCDATRLERAALRRGAEVERLDTGGPIVEGAAWRVGFTFRGKRREVEAKVTDHDAPNGFRVVSVSGGLDGLTTVELVPLTPHRTRLIVGQEITPRTLSARLMVQSLKLAKGSLDARFRSRVAEFAGEIAQRHRARG